MPTEKNTLFGFKDKSHLRWIGMIVFVSVWMFVLGIFVGRGTAPVKFDIEKLQKELVALKETVLREQKERFESFMETAQKKTDLGFYETLKAPEGADKPEKVMAKTKPVEISPGPTKSIPPAQIAGNAGKNLTIQVSSLKDVEAADALVAKLKLQGYAAYRTTGEVPGKGTWYRVRVGYYKNKAEAEAVIKQLSQDKYKPYLVKWR